MIIAFNESSMISIEFPMETAFALQWLLLAYPHIQKSLTLKGHCFLQDNMFFKDAFSSIIS